jgi:uncharacterized membrane protein YtjA (UPF0391 family)
MLHYAVAFFVSAVIVSVLGLRSIAGSSEHVGWSFAVIAIVFLAVAMLDGCGVAVP